MKLIKNGTIILFIGILGLFIIIGAGLCEYFSYQSDPTSYTQQEITAMEIEPININTAGFEELDKLPTLDDQQIQNIIDYRRENGEFTSKEDVIMVKGIGKKTYQKIALYITV